MKLAFATANSNKAAEIARLLPDSFEIVTLKDLQVTEDIPETADTLEGNAHLKAAYVMGKYGVPCFADDTGLEISALGNRPGVRSARYAGEHRSDEDNMQKVLSELENQADRSARFRTVIALHLPDNKMEFEGIVEGEILHQKQGTEGFGYDPIFSPEEESRSFAEMSMDEKNAISHRGRAIKKLVDYLIKLHS
ncbi:MAG: non-canonical purine NTP diphosphatase [bacterium]|nr:non-canonical purine NTP diphosphatase [bacterium]